MGAAFVAAGCGIVPWKNGQLDLNGILFIIGLALLTGAASSNECKPPK